MRGGNKIKGIVAEGHIEIVYEFQGSRGLALSHQQLEHIR